jgi:multisubunit Na+/H+ antiporter MnhF subunit
MEDDMSMWMTACVALSVGGAFPAVLLGLRSGAIERLVGLQQLAAVFTLLLLVFAQASGQPSYLTVPLVLVLLSFTGTLVFTRLLVPRR